MPQNQIIMAFLGGGAICLAVQLLIDLTKITPGRILTLLVTLGVLLYATGLYDPLYSLFGCGVSLPLCGFGAVIGKGVRDAIDAVGPIGIISGGLSAAAAGISAALILGFLLSLFFKGKPKRMKK